MEAESSGFIQFPVTIKDSFSMLLKSFSIRSLAEFKRYIRHRWSGYAVIFAHKTEHIWGTTILGPVLIMLKMVYFTIRCFKVKTVLLKVYAYAHEKNFMRTVFVFITFSTCALPEHSLVKSRVQITETTGGIGFVFGADRILTICSSKGGGGVRGGLSVVAKPNRLPDVVAE